MTSLPSQLVSELLYQKWSYRQDPIRGGGYLVTAGKEGYPIGGYDSAKHAEHTVFTHNAWVQRFKETIGYRNAYFWALGTAAFPALMILLIAVLTGEVWAMWFGGSVMVLTGVGMGIAISRTSEREYGDERE